MKNYLFALIILLSFSSIGQEKFTLSGTVSDSTKGEELINTTIKVKGQNIGIRSNEYGFYSLTLPKGNYTIVFVGLLEDIFSRLISDKKSNRLFFVILLPCRLLSISSIVIYMIKVLGPLY